MKENICKELLLKMTGASLRAVDHNKLFVQTHDMRKKGFYFLEAVLLK